MPLKDIKKHANGVIIEENNKYIAPWKSRSGKIDLLSVTVLSLGSSSSCHEFLSMMDNQVSLTAPQTASKETCTAETRILKDELSVFKVSSNICVNAIKYY